MTRFFRDTLKFFLPLAYRFVSLRETCKSFLILKGHELRIAYRRLAEKLCENGYLPDPSLIFFLTHYEVGQLISDRNPALIQK